MEALRRAPRQERRRPVVAERLRGKGLEAEQAAGAVLVLVASVEGQPSLPTRAPKI